ncbi:MAG: hypothetical protein LKG10_04400 [Lactobacillus delbrueckii]|jgi:hypothetical protein|nr:hypothetical protein [Lactobacillus delbrueckii]
MRRKLKRNIVVVLGVLLLLQFKSTVKADVGTSNSDNEFVKAYSIGRSKGILTDDNMTESDFVNLCKNTVYPRYLKYSYEYPGMSFEDYLAEDNYEVPVQTTEDKPIVINHKSSTASTNKIGLLGVSANRDYKMKAGDILVCYGTSSSSNSIPNHVGHAAIASSSSHILEMPNIWSHATHVGKASWFAKHTKGKDYVAVYRVKKHPYYAEDAAGYAYHDMYINNNPKYLLSPNLYDRTTSYCSKYVYCAWYYGATKDSVKHYNTGHYVLPHSFIGNWKGSFVASYVYKVTEY